MDYTASEIPGLINKALELGASYEQIEKALGSKASEYLGKLKYPTKGKEDDDMPWPILAALGSLFAGGGAAAGGAALGAGAAGAGAAGGGLGGLGGMFGGAAASAAPAAGMSVPGAYGAGQTAMSSGFGGMAGGSGTGMAAGSAPVAGVSAPGAAAGGGGAQGAQGANMMERLMQGEAPPPNMAGQGQDMPVKDMSQGPGIERLMQMAIANKVGSRNQSQQGSQRRQGNAHLMSLLGG